MSSDSNDFISIFGPGDSISLEDLLSVSTGSSSGVKPSQPDKEAEFILQPTATDGAQAYTSLIFRDANETITGRIEARYEAGAESLLVQAVDRPLELASQNGSVIIQDLSWPTTDGSTNQVLTTDGAGSLFWATVSSGPGNSESYIAVTAPGTTLAAGNRYFIAASIVVTLPSYASLAPGDAITAAKSVATTPTIAASATQTIQTDKGQATEILFDSTDEITFVYDGTNWQLQYTGTDLPVDLPTDLTDLDDVNVTNPASGQVLRFTGSSWENAVLDYADLSGTPDIGNSRFIIPSNGQILTPNRSYFVGSQISVTLPDYTNLIAGDNVRLTKSSDVSPTINATVGQDVKTDVGTSNSVLLDVTDEVVFIFNGILWEMQYSGTSSSTNLALTEIQTDLTELRASQAELTQKIDLPSEVNPLVTAMSFVEFQTKRRNGKCKIFRETNVTEVTRTQPGIYKIQFDKKTINGINLLNDGFISVELNFKIPEDDVSSWEMAGITKKSNNGEVYVIIKIIHILEDGSRIVEEPINNNGHKNKILVRVI